MRLNAFSQKRTKLLTAVRNAVDSSRMSARLADLERGFPADAHQAGVAYAQSAHVVAWLQVTHGNDALRSLLSATLDGRTLDQAARSATGVPLAELDRQYRATLSQGGIAWQTWLGQDMIWWWMAVFAVVVIVVVRRRQRRRYLAIKAREAEQDALMDAIWSGRFLRGSWRGPRGE